MKYYSPFDFFPTIKKCKHLHSQAVKKKKWWATVYEQTLDIQKWKDGHETLKI